MNGYEKLIKTMRKEAIRADTGYPLKLAVMTSNSSCILGQLELDADDLYLASHLVEKLKIGDVVLICRVSNEKYAIIEKMMEV